MSSAIISFGKTRMFGVKEPHKAPSQADQIRPPESTSTLIKQERSYTDLRVLAMQGFYSVPEGARIACVTAALGVVPGAIVFDSIVFAARYGYKAVGQEFFIPVSAVRRLAQIYSPSRIPLQLAIDSRRSAAAAYQHYSSDWDASERFVGSAACTVFVSAATNPFSVIRSHLQLDKTGKYQGSVAKMMAELPPTIGQKTRVLMAGCGATMVRDLSFYPAQMMCRTKIERLGILGTPEEQAAHPVRTTLTAAAICGTATAPLGHITVRVTQALRDETKRTLPVREALRRIVDQDGRGSIRRAVATNIMRLPIAATACVAQSLLLEASCTIGRGPSTGPGSSQEL